MGRILVIIATLLVAQFQGVVPADENKLFNTTSWLKSLRSSADSLRWSDEAIQHGWRLQRQPGTENYRVLDPKENTLCSGDADECHEAFVDLMKTNKNVQVFGSTVIVLHGLGRGRQSMKPLVNHLRDSLRSSILSFGYASTKAHISEHGQALANVVSGLSGSTHISFVGHSLGNLVIRSWLSQASDESLEKLCRVVMLGPPNQGSDLAKKASKIWILKTFSQGAAKDLLIDWDNVSASLPAPPCSFGIVAGGKNDSHGFSALLDGDDDSVVRVAETRLSGSTATMIVPVRHNDMMQSPTVQDAVTAFLLTGQFPDQKKEDRHGPQ